MDNDESAPLTNQKDVARLPLDKKRVQVRPNNFSAMQTLWYERPDSNPSVPEVWIYTDKTSYRPGETVCFHVNGHFDRVAIEVVLDSWKPLTLYRAEHVAAAHHDTPVDAYRRGCGWPVTHTWRIPTDCPSGACVVSVMGRRGDLSSRHEHLFIVAPGEKVSASDRVLMVASTATWTAYNDWGGANHYFGIEPSTARGSSPVLSTLRPWSRGTVSLPRGAPRMLARRRTPPFEPFRIEAVEYAYANGLSKYYAASGWATFERPAFHWLESSGYHVDLISQYDLELNPELLAGYSVLLFIGHDEYWSWGMRESVHRFNKGGGNICRLAGNFMWQIRLEQSATQQVCYKYDAFDRDPVASTGPAERVTSAWEDRRINLPGALTFGVNGYRGVYSGFSGFQPGASRGFIVFRPDHWSFAHTDLGYAEIFGDGPGIFGHEVDGLEYSFVDGLPVPLGSDGAPDGLQILAMGFASNSEKSAGRESRGYYADSEARAAAGFLDGSVDADTIARRNRGSGMIVHFKNGDGEVFSAGTIEWVNGLLERDFATQQVTRNVLDRFLSRRS